MAPFVSTEVQARQTLNAQVGTRLPRPALLCSALLFPSYTRRLTRLVANILAVSLALNDGMDWLLHLDSDELFGLLDTTTLHQHFAQLDSAGIGQLTYCNHEGIPTMEDTLDPFLQVTHFRMHLCQVPLTSEAHRCIEFWKRRSPEGQYFLGYDNGKSAVRVLPGLVPASVHSWRLPPSSQLHSCSSMPDPRNLSLSHVYPVRTFFASHSDNRL